MLLLYDGYYCLVALQVLKGSGIMVYRYNIVSKASIHHEFGLILV